MRFLIYVGGLDNGFNTPVGGEGRYVCNMAQALVNAGHTVDCAGGGGPNGAPGWGTQVPVPGVNFINEHSIDPNIMYDAYINAPWELRDKNGTTVTLCRDTLVNARLFIHVMWSWNSGIEASIEPCWNDPHNHIVAYPYDQPELYVADKAPLRVIPNPVYKEYDPHAPQTRKGMVWAGKGVFVDDWPEDKLFHSEGIKLLKAMAAVSNRLDLTCNFVLTHKDFYGERAHRFGVPEVVGSIKSKQVFNGFIPKNQLDDLFLHSRVSIRPPHYSGSFLDSFPKGAVPLFYDGSQGGALGDLFNGEVNFFKLDMTQKDMEDVIERFFVDDDYYISVIKAAQAQMVGYSYESCCKHIMGIMDEFLS